uniref:Holin n=1 Tax=Siphoviridae sp. ctdcr45 TaxID=2825580 RepID=A0A8S5Q999_9CAUD|nr:MAG TPA: holin [Siphoviridae sp. ctdcr45]
MDRANARKGQNMKLNDKIYDTLKWVVMIVLPAIATLYAALAPVWGWPRPDDVVLTLNAVTAFAGAVLGISTAQYNKDKANEGDDNA